MLARDDTQPEEPGVTSDPTFLTPEEMAAAAVLSEKGDDFLMNGITEEETPPAEDEGMVEAGELTGAEEGLSDKLAGVAVEGEETPPAAEETPPDDFLEPFAPHYKVDGKTVAELDAEMDALEAKFDEGEVQGPDYRSQMRDLQAAHSQATTLESINTQTASQRWDHAERMFYVEDEGANSIFRDDAVMRGALDAALKVLYVSDEGKSEAWYLHHAAVNVRKVMGMAAPAVTPEDPPPLTKKNAGGRGDHGEPPATLGNIPAADAHQEGGEFAGLDGLEGMEFERAFANLSVAQQDQFLSS